MSKPMSRAQMKRAAQALVRTCMSEASAAEVYDVPLSEIDFDNQRCGWCRLYHFGAECWDIEASMLMGEAHRPVGHDGDGTDEP